LSNAVKFTPRGQVDLRVRLQAHAAQQVSLRFEVSDTGIGLSAEQLGRVFDAFAQADASTTRRFGGTGLGLAISKRLVQLMQGSIGADSQPGAGSTFWVELPLQPATAPAPAPRLAPPPPGAVGRSSERLRGARILVVEDNPINQEVATTLLGALGAAVELAGSGEEALRRFDPQRHELILMDVQMPGMDGLRATAAIRARPGGAQVPIVAMTANAFAEDRAQCLQAGMNDYLAKPVEPQALEQCLLRWLRPLEGGRVPAPQAALPGAEQALRRRLEALPELDTVGPLSRLRGSWPLYLRTLRMFLSHHAHDADRLSDPSLSADTAAMRALAHSISGAAATVGAVEVQRRAQALQAALGPSAGVSPARPTSELCRPLAEALWRFLQQVQEALRSDAPALPPDAALPPEPPLDRVAVQAVLAELEPLLKSHDTAALGLFERQRALLEAVLGPDARVLAQQLRSFSFGPAQLTLASARRHCSEAAADDQSGR
jgi:CheY-like chemotaxis protein